MEEYELDLQAGLTHATDRLMCAARTLAYWVADDDDLPAGTEIPSEETAMRAVGEAYEAIAQIQFIRLEIAGQMDLFGAIKSAAPPVTVQHPANPVARVAVDVDVKLCQCHKCATGRVIHAIGAVDMEALAVEGVMRVCPICGNKRCPKASNHNLDCTGSNDAGQHGSVYP